MFLKKRNGFRPGIQLLALLLTAFWPAISNHLYAQGNCDCTNCPQFMPDGFTGAFNITVQNACNPTLGQNGQGVCGVNINFDHEYLGDLSISLVSPSGQSVQLVGPIGFFGPTDGSSWNVSFVPCGDAADPDPGFSGTWQNNQAWGLGNTYFGSYHPNSGCLENFNSGPVNGTWSLVVTDGQAIDVGNFYDYEIIFCDPSCIDCFSCEANAGQLTQQDITACQGSNALTVNLPPSYSPPNVAPTPGVYAYTYAVANSAGVIQEYTESIDLSGYDPGNYTVCGISILAAQQPDLPEPDGSLTLTQLNNLINSTSSSLCADITSNCVGFNILPAPEDEENWESICAPGCFIFGNQAYCNSGDYTVTLNQNGCPYQSTLHLTVLQPSDTLITETICEGFCSTVPGFEDACSPGLHIINLQNPDNNCDSIVRLNLTVLSAVANIQNPPAWNCNTTLAQLSGVGSTTGGGTQYLWTASNGGAIQGSPYNILAVITAPGDYQLRVCKSFGAFQCCDSMSVTVEATQDPPAAPTSINGPVSVCSGQQTNLSVVPVQGATSYTWTVPTGATINFGQNSSGINVSWPAGSGGEVCVVANNNCGSSDQVCLDMEVNIAPSPGAPQGPDTLCVGDNATYSVAALDDVTAYNWTVSSSGSIQSGQNTNEIDVIWNAPGLVQACISTQSACGPSAQFCHPSFVIATPQTPNMVGSMTACAGTTGTYTINQVAGATTYTWTVDGGTIISGQGSTSIQVLWDNNASTGSVCAEASNRCGESSPACINVTLGAAPALPVLSGDTLICAGINSAHSILPITGSTGYTWTVNGSGSIASGQNSVNLSVNWTGAPGGSVCVSALGSCGTGPQVCDTVVVSAQPVANAGPDDAICGTQIALSAIPSVANSTGNWSIVSGSGNATISQPGNSNTIVVAQQNGNMQFVWTELVGTTCVDKDTVLIHFNEIPQAGMISFNCNATSDSFTVSFPVTGGLAPYASTGGVIVNGFFVSAPVPNGIPFSFVVTDANGCVSPTAFGAYNCQCLTNAGTMNLTTLSACEGMTVQAQQQTPPTADGNDVGAFVLHTNSGTSLGTVLAQNNTGIFGFLPGMTYDATYYVSYVVGNNQNGSPNLMDPCLSVAQGQPVVFHAYPTANAGADDDNCGLSIDIAGNNGNGMWSVITGPAGSNLTFANPQNSTTTVNADANGTYQLAWTLDNFGCLDSDTLQIQLNASPLAGQISRVCDGTNENYSVVIPITGSASPFSVNGTPVSGTTFTSSLIPNNTPFNFTIQDANGCVSAAIEGVFNCLCATNAGTMNLSPLEVCEGGSISAEHLGGQVLDANDTSAYVLHTNSGTLLGTVLSQNQTGVFTFGPGMAYDSTYYVSFVVGNNVANAVSFQDPCLSVAQGQPVIFHANPQTSAGVDLNTCGLELSLSASLDAAGNGEWTVIGSPVGGNLVFDDPSNPTALVTASQSGSYQLLWTETRFGCPDTDEVTLNFNSSPSLLDLERNCDAANENFTVTLQITGGQMPYSVNGQPIASDLFVSPAFANGENYTFNVTDANGCPMAEVTGAYSCNCTTNPGAMSLTPITLCEGGTATATVLTPPVLDANDVKAFVMHDGAAAALGNIFAQNQTGVFNFQPGMQLGQTYYISQVVGNNLAGLPNPLDPCLGITPGQPVVWLENPTPDAGPDDQICGQSIDLQSVGSLFSGVWTLSSGPGAAQLATPSQPQTNVTVDAFGLYTFRWTETNGICVAKDSVEIRFNPSPELAALDETCDGTNTTFVVSFNAQNGSAPYTVTGLSGTFSSNTFTSGALTSPGVYQFVIVDANGCESPQIAGSKDCNCTTDAGTMISAAAVFCAGQTASVMWDGQSTTDANDIVQFILHDVSGSTVGTIFATSATPSFTYSPTFETGRIYYISAVAGNNNNGNVDLQDPCLSVAPGTPVSWKPLPTATLAGATTICSGSDVVLTFGATGELPLEITWFDGTSNQSLVLNNALPVSQTVVPQQTTIYSLVSVSDGTNPVCSSPLNQQITVQVSQPVDAGLPTSPAEFCAGAVTSVNLTTLIEGETPGGQWKYVSNSPLGSGLLNASTGQLQSASLAAGSYPFAYTIQAAAPCPSDSVAVGVVVHANPTADAGDDQTITCNEPTADLGGNLTSVGSEWTYSWLLGNDTIATTAKIEVDSAGQYRLLVSSIHGCFDQDPVSVTAVNTPPQAVVRPIGVRCFGEKNGRIDLDSIQSASPPVLVSIDGGPYKSGHSFFPIIPGKHSIVLVDANGCEQVYDSVWIKEPEKLTPELGLNATIELGDSAHVLLQLNPNAVIDTIIWTPLLNPLQAGWIQQDFYPLESVQVAVEVIDSSGCKATDRTYVYVDDTRHIYIPNIIKLDDDNNQIAAIMGGRDADEVLKFQIFDRWGNEVYSDGNFKPVDPNRGWNGKFRGKDVQLGVFVYYALVRFIDGEEVLFKGDITVYR